MTDDHDLAPRKISNGRIFAISSRPVHFMFGSVVRFSWSAARLTLFAVGPKFARRDRREG